MIKSFITIDGAAVGWHLSVSGFRDLKYTH